MQPAYRTLRVLQAIRERPGSTNRQLADAAGIEDEGQASKLLKRWQGLGLIENTGPATQGQLSASDCCAATTDRRAETPAVV